MCRESVLLKLYVDEVQRFIRTNEQTSGCQDELDKLALDTLVESHARLGRWIRTGKIELVFVYAARFLGMMVEVTLSWLLLEAALIAAQKLTAIGDADPDVPFYNGKIASTRYFINNHFRECPLLQISPLLRRQEPLRPTLLRITVSDTNVDTLQRLRKITAAARMCGGTRLEERLE